MQIMKVTVKYDKVCTNFLNSILLDVDIFYILSQNNCAARGIKQSL